MKNDRLDKNYITLADGSCIGKGCMHDTPVFTDEDLMRLKFGLESAAPNWVDKDNLSGLLARLEAAERLAVRMDAIVAIAIETQKIMQLSKIEMDLRASKVLAAIEDVKAWRRAAGNE